MSRPFRKNQYVAESDSSEEDPENSDLMTDDESSASSQPEEEENETIVDSENDDSKLDASSEAEDVSTESNKENDSAVSAYDASTKFESPSTNSKSVYSTPSDKPSPQTPSRIPVRKVLLPIPKSLIRNNAASLRKEASDSSELYDGQESASNSRKNASSELCDETPEDGDVSMASIPSPPRTYTVPLAESSILPSQRQPRQRLGVPLAESSILLKPMNPSVKPNIISPKGLSPRERLGVPLAESSILPRQMNRQMVPSVKPNIISPKGLSPRERLGVPLAESSILPQQMNRQMVPPMKPQTMPLRGVKVERQSSEELKDSIQHKFTTKFLGIPKTMLTKSSSPPKSGIPVVDLDSSDDDIIEASMIEESPKPAPLTSTSKPVEVVLESDSSSSGVSEAASSSNSNSLPRNENSTGGRSRLIVSGSSQTSVNNSASSQCSNASTGSQSELRQLKHAVEKKAAVLRNLVFALKNCDTRKLKDGGRQLQESVKRCQMELEELKKRHNNMSAELEPEVEVIETKMDTKKDIIFSSKDQKTAHLGQKAMETHNIQKALTMDALVTLHSGLASTPAEDVLEDPPSGLKVDLMPHQRQALAWLLHRERQTPAGGILADDMGLGKTLTMIALVMRSSEVAPSTTKTDTWQSRSTGKKHPGKTLVVAPASLIGQWESQVEEHVKRGRLKTIIHHGTNREGRGSMLTDADIVITTYGVITQENKTKVATFRVAWERIILDEAHQIRNPKTQAAIAACELESKYRWCLTGTPINNKELDIYSLLKFLRCSPFDDLTVWKRWVDNKTPEGTQRLNTVVKSIMLRRTKEELKAQGELKSLLTKEMHPIRVQLDDEELKVYENVMNFSKTLLAQYLQQRQEKADGGLFVPGIQRLQNQLESVSDVKTHDILVLLLRLRQICCLPGLISAMLEEDAAKADGFEKEDPAVENLFKQVRRLTITGPQPPEESPTKDTLEKILLTSNPVFNISRPSSKMRRVMKVVKKIVELGDKVVVVSQWSSYLRHLAQHLAQENLKFDILDGSVPVKLRGGLVQRFNNPDSNLKILLLTLTAGGVGLNLAGANHLILMEPHWNPQLEAQACDRVYRVGQPKPVHIYKIICQDTIEERIEALQEKKLNLAQTVLTGQMRKEIAKLSLQDLRSLFGLAPM